MNNAKDTLLQKVLRVLDESLFQAKILNASDLIAMLTIKRREPCS